MQPNVGSTDRIIRIVLGIALIAGFFYTAAPLNYILLAAGIVAIATGMFRFCGLYKLLGINTCRAG